MAKRWIDRLHTAKGGLDQPSIGWGFTKTACRAKQYILGVLDRLQTAKGGLYHPSIGWGYIKTVMQSGLGFLTDFGFH